MTAVPARVAGVGEVVVCSPPRADGSVDDAVLAAAALAEVDELYRVGGAGAIAAMAYGTESIRPVDVIVGPGSAYTSAAKRIVAPIVGIDGFAGPSEVAIVCRRDRGPGAGRGRPARAGRARPGRRGGGHHLGRRRRRPRRARARRTARGRQPSRRRGADAARRRSRRAGRRSWAGDGRGERHRARSTSS